MPTINVKPFGRSLEAKDGAILRDVLQGAGILLDYPCGGKGSCRQCRVIVDPPPAAGIGKLKEAEAAGGVRLACQLPVTTDCTVTIPEERLSRVAWKQGLRDADVEISGGSVRRVAVRLPEPSLEDQRSDWDRVEAGLRELGITAPEPAPGSVETISRIFRSNGWKADALCEENTLLALQDGGQTGCYGFGVDLGTTTVDIALLDLETGTMRARKAFLNRQVAFGADVISRAQSFHDERGPVRNAALQTIDEGARLILAETGVSPSQVVKTVVVGNPIMIHILNGIDPYQLTHLPYIPVTSRSVKSAPGFYGWTFQGQGYVETLPLVSAYVGADTIGMIVSLDLEQEKRISLSIDIGTNGEMVLARHGEMVTTSTAAGPAFEGAQISCGMRALPGAVLDVVISPDGELFLKTVSEAVPKGICGTGLIAGIAQLLDCGAVDSTGRIVEPEDIAVPGLRSRIFSLGSESAFALSDDRSVYISQNDIRKLQLAKGAVRTGIETLLEVTGVAKEDLDSLRLAGNFGAGLDARAAMRIGLIPEMDLARVQVVGNAALRGALLVLASRESWKKSQDAARNARFIELGGKPEFQARFMDSMMFPG
jgi:uncharacterized 2Fe-2S/4Fe-4S cluster protein (DUF4445 family)